MRKRTLWQVRPTRRNFGWKCGVCIDRYYIEQFLGTWADDIRGHVLEVGDPAYTLRFGKEKVLRSDVLHVKSGNAQATIVADLTVGDNIPSVTFDAVIVTQTLQFIYDIRPAIQTLHRILKPRGVLLATVPGISQISRYDMDNWGEYWRFTTMSARRLFMEVFPESGLTVIAHGNVLTAMGFLHGLVTDELRPHELEYNDPDYELLIGIRAVKSASAKDWDPPALA
jgi:SAM-dependent methyltransferase